MKNRIVIAISILSSFATMAQPTTLVWQHLWSEVNTDTRLERVVTTPDNHYLVAGYRSAPSNGLDYDFLVAKFAPDSDLPIWTTSLGGSGEEKAYDMLALPDGGAVLVGQSNSPDGDVDTLLGAYDAWVVRLDANGELLWSKVFGGSNIDVFNAVTITSDNQLLVTGNTESSNGDVTDNKGYKDLWLVKINLDNGDLLWQRTFGGSLNDLGNSVLVASDNATVYVGGYSSSYDFDVSGNHGGKDFWLLQVDINSGDLLWQRCYGGSASDGMTDLTYIDNGNIALLGDSLSDDGEVGDNNGIDDFWVVAINPADNGNIVWQRNIGSLSFDQSRSLLYTPNHRLLLTGVTFDGSLLPPEYLYDIFFCQLDSQTGVVLWSDNVGGSLYDTATSTVVALNGSGYYSVGNTDSQDGDIDIGGGNSDRHGAENGFLFHFLEPEIGIENQMERTVKLYPNPVHDGLQIELPAELPKAQMHLYNSQLQCVLTQWIDHIGACSVAHLPAGYYYVELIGERYSRWQTLVIE